MMMMVAGGPGAITPIDYGQKRKPLSAAVWAAIGVSALVHVGLAAWLYYQRYEVPAAPIVPDNPIIIDLFTPEPPPPIEREPIIDVAPPTPVHRPETVTTSEIEPFHVPPIDSTVPTNSGPIINLNDAPPESTGTVIAPPTPAPPTVITSPAWSRRPTPTAADFPQRAMDRGVSGSATVRCVAQASGRPADCVVVSETPANMGFGRSAVRVVERGQLSPRTVNGAAENATFTVRIPFQLADE